jgi:hypothetical protein
MLATAKRWLAKGLLDAPAHFDLVLGIPGAMPGTPQALMYLLSELPAGATWTVAGIGAAQLPLATLAMVLGGHVRVGFEDNVYYRKGELASSNAQLVAAHGCHRATGRTAAGHPRRGACDAGPAAAAGLKRRATAPAGPDHTASSGAGAGWGNSLTHKPGASIGLGSGTRRTLTLPCVQPAS